MALAAILLYELMGVVIGLASILIFSEQDYERNYFMIDTVMALILSVLYAAWLYRLRKKDPDDRAEKLPINGRTLLSLSVITLGLKGIAWVWLVAVELGLKAIPILEESAQSHAETWSALATQPYIWTLLSVAVVGPIVEELLFRGLVFRYMEKIRTGWFPIIVSGILFGLWHKEPVQCVYAALIGIALGIVYARVRDLRAVMGIHMLHNFMGTLPPMIDTDTVQMVITCAAFVMIVPTLRLLVRMSRKGTRETVPL